jgi:hypothetical protein
VATRRAKTVSISKLMASVDKAVEAAARKHGIGLEATTQISRWEIIGRVLRNSTDLSEARALATEVTKTAALQGMKVDPVVTQIGGDILVGFVPRTNSSTFGV